MMIGYQLDLIFKSMQDDNEQKTRASFESYSKVSLEKGQQQQQSQFSSVGNVCNYLLFYLIQIQGRRIRILPSSSNHSESKQLLDFFVSNRPLRNSGILFANKYN